MENSHYGGAPFFNHHLTTAQQQPTSQSTDSFMITNEQIDNNLSNLLIGTNNNNNEFDHVDTAALDEFEEMERTLNENLLGEKEQTSQRLFQSFQTSACAVAQMFKDKQALQQNLVPNPTAQLTAWQSFQNAAGAITVLYKDSLDACKSNMDIGIGIGQQRKLKEIITWVKKKKKRTIRKDELIAFLIGKQYPVIESESTNPLFRRRQQQQQPQQRQNSTNSLLNSSSTQTNQFNSMSITNTTTNSMMDGVQQQQQQQNNDSAIVETNADLATFREALIMHNRSRDGSTMYRHHMGHHHNSHHHGHLGAAHHNHHHNHHPNTGAPATTVACDDLDCFFCEQIATHIEHKRSAANSNLSFDMDSPTRKRSRFY